MPNLTKMDELIRTGVIKRGDDPNLVCNFLPIGIPSLDEMLGGGVPMGRGILSYGPESTGKTLLAQYIAAAVQRSPNPEVLYMDMERSFDAEWWQASGVNASKIMVSNPATGDEATDVMRAVLHDEERLGLVILDSLGAMVPTAEMDEKKSSQDASQPGAQAKLITKMYRQIYPLLGNKVIFYAINQMRDNIGGYDEMGALPGGRAQKHYSHIILRTRRENWITENDNRIGFYMDIVQKKNKVASTPDGSNITIPFLYRSQFDWTATYIEDGIRLGIIVKAGPYYKYEGQSHLGKPNLRTFFTEHPEVFEELKVAVHNATE